MLALFEVGANQSDPLLEALRVSGPTGVLVILLGMLIRQWLGGVKQTIEKLELGVETIRTDRQKDRIAAVEDLSGIKHTLNEHTRRIERLEKNT